MQIIQQNAVFHDLKLKNFINRLTVTELNNLSEPCYHPSWKKYYNELLHLTELKEKDIKEFIKRFYLGTKAQDALLQSDIGSNLLIILMYHFLEKKDQQTYNTIMVYYMIRQYANFFKILLPAYCKPDVFSYTLDHLNPNHLFSREKTISNTLYYLANEMRKRYTSAFLELNPEKISLFLYESRGRIAQSLKSFMEFYYRNNELGLGLGTSKEDETGKEIFPEELRKGQRIAETIANKICVYKELDYKAFESARKLTKVNTAISMVLIKELQNIKLANDIKFIVELFFKDMKTIRQICGPELIPYVKKLMSLKRTTKSVYFKQEINTLLLKTIKGSKFEEKYNKLTNQTKFQFSSFLAYYIGFYIKNIVC
jgi:hypothetical protein